MLVQEHGIDVVGMACDMAVEQNTLRLAAIINLINQLVEPVIELLPEAHFYPSLQVAPKADCKRYEVLYTAQGDMVHIPGYPPTYSDNIRPFVPGYPPSFDALP